MITNCKNCGATLDYKQDDELCICKYCGTKYPLVKTLDGITRIKDYIIELDVMNKKREFYISEFTINRLYSPDCGRDLQGNLKPQILGQKIKMELIEL